MGSEPEDLTLHLPRLLCLHGGGTNHRIFRAQCRGIEYWIKSNFRLCYAEAPYDSNAGPDVLSVYAEWGPFRRWLRWLPEHPVIEHAQAVEDIEACLRKAMIEDDEKGATGEWVGLLGFSQGAKLAASLLYRQQLREELTGRDCRGPHYRLAALFAGRAPLVWLESEPQDQFSFSDTSQTTTSDIVMKPGTERLRLPTIHVHGLRDPGRHYHRQLLNETCEEGTARLIEFDGEHRMPFKTKDVQAAVNEILAVARETGLTVKDIQ